MSQPFTHELDRFIDYVTVTRPSIKNATVSVTESYARRRLKLKKDAPLIYRGLSLKCIGPKKWRNENQSAR